jgi:hypothetical protein
MSAEGEMTAEPTAEPAEPTAEPTAEPADDGRMFCYRHPDRETWVRCGRCDRPICTRCAMQGPVGMRCRDCGKPVRDPLTAMTPRQALGGAAVAVGGGAIVAFIALEIGFFGILIGYFGGRFIAEMLERAIGYKRGPMAMLVIGGGIALGAVLGTAIGVLTFFGGEAAEFFTLTDIVRAFATSTLITIGALLFGVYSRLR